MLRVHALISLMFPGATIIRVGPAGELEDSRRGDGRLGAGQSSFSLKNIGITQSMEMEIIVRSSATRKVARWAEIRGRSQLRKSRPGQDSKPSEKFVTWKVMKPWKPWRKHISLSFDTFSKVDNIEAKLSNEESKQTQSRATETVY